MAVTYNATDQAEHAEFRAELADISHRLSAAINLLELKFAPRGVPIKGTRSRLRRSQEYLTNAIEYWDYDVIKGITSGTKLDQEKREEHDLS